MSTDASRLRLVLHVYVFYVLGVFLLAVPWTPLWELAVGVVPASWVPFVRSGWPRGAVTGLGVLDLYAAAREAGSLLHRLHAGGSETS